MSIKALRAGSLYVDYLYQVDYENKKPVSDQSDCSIQTSYVLTLIRCYENDS